VGEEVMTKSLRRKDMEDALTHSLASKVAAAGRAPAGGACQMTSATVPPDVMASLETVIREARLPLLQGSATLTSERMDRARDRHLASIAAAIEAARRDELARCINVANEVLRRKPGGQNA
jgi:hypothetical protein